MAEQTSSIPREVISRLERVHRGELWVAGDLSCFAQARAVLAIVGMRRASEAAIERTRKLAETLAGQGVVVVSGGAMGIDGAAHRGALDGGGKTVVVLGTGIDVTYPSRHHELFEEVVEQGGALISPFPPGTGPERWRFPKRNPLIAALSDGVLVTSGEGRSGALQTARAAFKLGRKVMAVPGSAAGDALLLDGAYRVDHAADVWAALEGRRRAIPVPEGDVGRVLSVCLGDRALSVEEVATNVGLSLPACHGALLRLTLMRYVARLPGERFQRLGTVH